MLSQFLGLSASSVRYVLTTNKSRHSRQYVVHQWDKLQNRANSMNPIFDMVWSFSKYFSAHFVRLNLSSAAVVSQDEEVFPFC